MESKFVPLYTHGFIFGFLTGIDNDAKADLLKSRPLECQNIFVINSKDDYEILKNKLMEQY